MARFFGRYEHSLDTKGRLILPSRFRGPFAEGGFLTAFRDGCLALWTPEEFDKRMAAMEHSEEGTRDERNLARLWASETLDVVPDAQGRIPISPNLREFAQLDAAVLVTGANRKVELWDPQRWQDRVKPSEAKLIDPEDEG